MQVTSVLSSICQELKWSDLICSKLLNAALQQYAHNLYPAELKQRFILKQVSILISVYKGLG